MKRTIAILTKSKKFNGYCVAGIDMKTNEWVRLEHPMYRSLSSSNLLLSNGGECDILYVVEVECLDEPSKKQPYQPENVTFNPRYRFRFLYKTSWSTIFSRITKANKSSNLILGIDSLCETIENVAKLNDKSSLQLIHVTDLRIYTEDTNHVSHPKADFTYGGKRWYYFSVTDYSYLNLSKTISFSSAYLIVSRGVPFRPSHKNEYYHYSLVAKIIDDPSVSKIA